MLWKGGKLFHSSVLLMRTLRRIPLRKPPRRKSINTPAPIYPAISNAGDVLSLQSPAAGLLSQNSLIIGRQIEMMNVLIGYEQANKYEIKNQEGQIVGFIAEDDSSIGKSILRNLLRTRRAFNAVVFDASGENVILKIQRPFKWFLNSKIAILDAKDQEIGAVHQVFHIWRRKYDLFDSVSQSQFCKIDGGFLTWDFEIVDKVNRVISTVNRNFGGFAREIFTDSGQYVCRFQQESSSLTLDQRAIVLACAINIDVDYFSRHSGNGGFLPIGMVGGGSGVPAPVPGGGAAGGMGMPVPIIIPGMSSSDDQVLSDSPEPQAPVSDQQAPPPTWDDDPFLPDNSTTSDSGFLSDEETGLGGSSWGDMFGKINDFLDDD